ncbi:putative F-box protein [Cardamine amara subsp. amara]|uniref:F-box protein n=1 Tax=Cardamine amara subsp. amara TaxID=228776 RepID=A0ABD0ZC67_CARAN
MSSFLGYDPVEKHFKLMFDGVTMVVCFDVRSEKFTFVKVMETFDRDLPRTTTLINYSGKLGLLMTDEYDDDVSGKNESFELWILEDVGKHEWSVLPPSGRM